MLPRIWAPAVVRKTSQKASASPGRADVPPERKQGRDVPNGVAWAEAGAEGSRMGDDAQVAHQHRPEQIHQAGAHSEPLDQGARGSVNGSASFDA